MHQCMRNLDWLLVGEFNQGLQEPCSFPVEVLAPRVQPSRGEWESQCSHRGASQCGELCFGRWWSMPLTCMGGSPRNLWSGAGGKGNRRQLMQPTSLLGLLVHQLTSVG